MMLDDSSGPHLRNTRRRLRTPNGRVFKYKIWIRPPFFIIASFQNIREEMPGMVMEVFIFVRPKNLMDVNVEPGRS